MKKAEVEKKPIPASIPSVFSVPPRNLVMYVFINKGLQMSAGKIAAQAVQAGVGSYRISNREMAIEWFLMGGHHTTLVMEARNEQHLLNIQTYLQERDFKSSLMIDEGMTEIEGHSATALAVEIVDKNEPHVQKTFESFKLYRDTVRVTLEIDR